MTLAMDGGRPVRRTAFPPWPQVAEDEIEAAASVLRSGKINYWTGTQGREFEKEFAAAVGTRHAVALANGTVALELALHALGIGPGDEVVVTSRTFVASASCVIARGARPVFADVDRDSGNITAATVERALTPRTRAIIAVHLAGWPCEMDALRELARPRGIRLIEDCAQAHGAAYKGRAAGSLGDAAGWSFCQDKIITTAGEGGMLTTDDPEIWRRSWEYKDHGKSWDAVHRQDHAPGFRWLHESFGTNWRLTEVQAAVGRRALRKLRDWVAVRRRNAAFLDERFARMKALRITVPPHHVLHSYYRYHVYVRPEALRSGWTRDRIMDAVQAEGVPCFSGSCSEIYLEKAFPADMRPRERLPVARELGETCLMLPVYPTLGELEMRDAADAVEKVLAAATA